MCVHHLCTCAIRQMKAPFAALRACRAARRPPACRPTCIGSCGGKPMCHLTILEPRQKRATHAEPRGGALPALKRRLCGGQQRPFGRRGGRARAAHGCIVHGHGPGRRLPGGPLRRSRRPQVNSAGFGWCLQKVTCGIECTWGLSNVLGCSLAQLMEAMWHICLEPCSSHCARDLGRGTLVILIKMSTMRLYLLSMCRMAIQLSACRRHRLVVPKYNPARTFTPEGAVGLGGTYLCIYPMESPGGAWEGVERLKTVVKDLVTWCNLPAWCCTCYHGPMAQTQPGLEDVCILHIWDSKAGCLMSSGSLNAPSGASLLPHVLTSQHCTAWNPGSWLALHRVPSGGAHAADLEHVRARQALHAADALAAALL